METTQPPCLQYRRFKSVQQLYPTSLRVMTYNILADSLLEATFKKDYILRQPDLFEWKHRAPKLFKEIEHIQPDILFLQEYDTHEEILKNMLNFSESTKHYEMVVKGKTGGKMDGVALLFSKDKFILVDYVEVELSAGANDPQMDRDNVAQVVVLRLTNNQVVLAANCHLLFNRKRGDIKMWQAHLIQTAIDKLVLKYKHSHKIVLWAGDFNSAPCGLLYLYMHRHKVRLNITHPSLIGASENNIFNKYYDKQALKHHLNQARTLFKTKKGFTESTQFMDAYQLEEVKQGVLKAKNVSEGGKLRMSDGDVVKKSIRYQSCVALFNGYQQNMAAEMSFTQKSHSDIGTVDYIWAAVLGQGQTTNEEQEMDNVQVHSILDGPQVDDFWQKDCFQLRLPNEIFPSDHLPIVLSLSF